MIRRPPTHSIKPQARAFFLGVLNENRSWIVSACFILNSMMLITSISCILKSYFLKSLSGTTLWCSNMSLIIILIAMNPYFIVRTCFWSCHWQFFELPLVAVFLPFFDRPRSRCFLLHRKRLLKVVPLHSPHKMTASRLLRYPLPPFPPLLLLITSLCMYDIHRCSIQCHITSFSLH